MWNREATDSVLQTIQVQVVQFHSVVRNTRVNSVSPREVEEEGVEESTVQTHKGVLVTSRGSSWQFKHFCALGCQVIQIEFPCML